MSQASIVDPMGLPSGTSFSEVRKQGSFIVMTDAGGCDLSFSVLNIPVPK
jgi:hypothetical protein